MLFGRVAGYITLGHMMRVAKCQWCQQDISPAAQYCASCGMPAPLSSKGGNGSRNLRDILVIAACISFVVLLGSALPWFGSGRNWLMTVAVIALGGLTVALLVRHWKRRLPLRYRGSELRFEVRPFAYHVCTLMLILFALMMFIAGLGAAIADLRAMGPNRSMESGSPTAPAHFQR
jgi:hypothetical protein